MQQDSRRESLSQARPAAPFPAMPLGTSEAMARLRTQLGRAARTDATVFIVGESGTGKEVIARAIHETSARREGPFVAVNCGAISGTLAHAQLFGHEKGSFTGALTQHAGYIEHASAGTLFLDEVTEMPTDLQVHFLRVLESGTYERVGGSDVLRANIRVLCASNRDPAVAVAEGRLREDFFHRLLVLPLRVPPLRERPEDIAVLAQWFLDELNASHGTAKRFSRKMLEDMALHDWPGNGRELRNAVQRAFIVCDEVLESDFLDRARRALRTQCRDGVLMLPVGTPLARVHRELILATLAHHDGDKRLAAATLGITLKTLYNRLGNYQRS